MTESNPGDPGVSRIRLYPVTSALRTHIAELVDESGIKGYRALSDRTGGDISHETARLGDRGVQRVGQGDEGVVADPPARGHSARHSTTCHRTSARVRSERSSPYSADWTSFRRRGHPIMTE